MLTTLRLQLIHLVVVVSFVAMPAMARAQTSFAADPSSLGAIADGTGATCQQPGSPRDVTFTVSGLVGTVQTVSLTMNIQHAFVGDVLAQLIAPGGASHDLFGYTGSQPMDLAGDSSTLNGAYTFDDTSTTNWWLGAFTAAGSNPVPPGTYATSIVGGGMNPGANTSMNPAFAGVNPNGVWILRLRDGCQNNTGAVNTGTSLTLAVNPPTTTEPQPPTSFTVASVEGTRVTLRWTAPTSGPEPTGYVLEGGIQPAETLASLETGSTSPIFSFSAPTGAFRIRLHTLVGATRSGPSNEVPLIVSTAVAPSAPTNLLVSVNGTNVSLAWKNTFGGGVPESLFLDVSGQLSGSVPLELMDSVSFSGVPEGTYDVRLRALNDAGSSAASNVATITVPGACLSAPQPPANFLAYRVGNTIFLTWDPATTGPAPSSFVLNVTGAFNGVVPTTTRNLSGVVGPGTYQFSVLAANSCGSSAPTTTQSVTVPSS